MESPERVEEEVIIEPPLAKEQIDVTPQQKEQPKPVISNDDKIEKMHKRMEYQARQFERAMNEIKNLAEKITTVQPKQAPEPQVEEDEVDRVAQSDWKKGVKMVVTPEIERTVEELLNKREQARLEAQKAQTAQQVREKSMARVLEDHPEIEDEDSEFTRVYTSVLNEDPNLLSNPLGPELAMARAEKRLSKNSATINTETNSERVARVKAVYAPQGKQPSDSKRIVLTAEEKRICDEKGINYADYTKMRGLTQANFREGVSVDE